MYRLGHTKNVLIYSLKYLILLAEENSVSFPPSRKEIEEEENK